MNLKNIELDLKLAFNDKRFKIKNANNFDNTINKLEDILVRITKFNDALGNLSYLQTYYRDLFGLNKSNYADFNYNCSDIEDVIKNEQDHYISMFNDFIKILFGNTDLREFLLYDIPNTIKVVNKISKCKDFQTKYNELLDWFYKWLTYISYDEDIFDKLYLLMDKEIIKFYNDYLKEDKKE